MGSGRHLPRHCRYSILIGSDSAFHRHKELRTTATLSSLPFCSQAGKHPAAGEGMWGSEGEAPSFIYAMPLGGNRVFLEETCLVAKPALPFAVLKRRLERRLKAVGIKVTKARGFTGFRGFQHSYVSAQLCR